MRKDYELLAEALARAAELMEGEEPMQKYKVGDRLTLACGVEIVEITATSQLYELKKVNRDNTLSVRTIGVLDYELDELIAPEPLCCEMLTEATE